MWAQCFAAVVVASLACCASAQTILGYQISSSVKDYMALSTDICTIVDAMTATPYNFKLATEIYEKGKASGKKLKDIARTPRDGEPFFEKYKQFFGSATWNDDFIASALAGNGTFASINEDGRAEAVKKGIQSALMLFYMVHELDAALLTLRTRSNADNQNEGAGHNVDEAFAVWVGDSPGCGLYGVAERRANEYGTRSGCNGPGNVNMAMVEQFKLLKGAARVGDVPMFEAAYNEVIRLQYIVMAQSSLKYAIVLTKALDDAKAVDALEGDYVEGHTFYRAIAPYVASASLPASTALQAAWKLDAAPTAKVDDKVAAAFNQTYAAMKVDPVKDISNYSLQYDCTTNTLPATSKSLDASKASAAAAGMLQLNLAALLLAAAACVALLMGLDNHSSA